MKYVLPLIPCLKPLFCPLTPIFRKLNSQYTMVNIYYKHFEGIFGLDANVTTLFYTENRFFDCAIPGSFCRRAQVCKCLNSYQVYNLMWKIGIKHENHK